jgi:D-3-phosphoglycerate dehydrogenase
MIRVSLLNKISDRGLKLMPAERYECTESLAEPHGILVRSANMLDMKLPETLLAVARAGAGVNNIPVDRCSEKGIVVFNTPGANANSVKELVIMSLIMASRNIVSAVHWVKSLAKRGEEVTGLVEKGKSTYAGKEVKGKRLGVIGLGSVGVMVANDALALGMEVRGFDPFISVDHAWGLARGVGKAEDLDSLLAESDFITLHVPLNARTRGMLNAENFSKMKMGAVLLNFARGGLVSNQALRSALDQGILSAYVTDFPDDDLLNLDGVIPVPHLGASTAEAEENCAVMAVCQLMEFFEKGTIRNSVNLPDCDLAMTGKVRITVFNRNVPNMIGQITPILAGKNINIANMLNRSRDDFAYTIIDTDGGVDRSIVEKIRSVEGVLRVRQLEAIQGSW